MEILKTHKYPLLILISAISFGVFLLSASTFATSKDDIVYPVAELGGCKDETACRSYCEKPANIKPCVAFAEKHNLFPKEELERAKRFAEVGKGPGGCTSQASCESYCNDVKNIDECLAFAEKEGFISEQELIEAKKVQGAIAGGAKLPGGCKNKKECENYCQNTDKMEECLSFAEAAGFLPPDELIEAKKALGAIKKGVKPPPCRGKQACEDYCSEPQNFEQCIAFAEAAGFMSPEELAMAKKTGGKGPGGCKGRACKDFCEDEKNLPVCLDFAVENGMISSEDAQRARKTGGKGPGDCKGREQCEAFCQNPANQETCFNFGKEHGLIPEEDLRRMEEGKQKIQEALGEAPPGVKECLDANLGSGFTEKLQSGAVPPSREFGDKMRDCFEKTFREQGDKGFPGFGRPGGPEDNSGGQFPGRPGGPEGFPGAPGQFPGKPGEFPGGHEGQFPGRSGEQNEFPGRPGGFEGIHDGHQVPGGHEFEPEGVTPEEFGGKFREEYQKEYKKQFNKQSIPGGTGEQREKGAFPGTWGQFQGKPGEFPGKSGGTSFSGGPEGRPGFNPDNMPEFMREKMQSGQIPSGIKEPSQGLPGSTGQFPGGSGEFLRVPGGQQFPNGTGGQFPAGFGGYQNPGGVLPPQDNPVQGGSYFQQPLNSQQSVPLPGGGTQFQQSAPIQSPVPSQSPPLPSSLRPPGLGDFLLKVFAGVFFGIY